jgi:hypothetical protein
MVHIALIFLSEWRELPSVPYLAGKNVMRTRVCMLKSHASSDMLPVSVCKNQILAIQHVRTFFPLTLLIPSCIIRQWIGLRTFQQPLIVKKKGIQRWLRTPKEEEPVWVLSR